VSYYYEVSFIFGASYHRIILHHSSSCIIQNSGKEGKFLLRQEWLTYDAERLFDKEL
jgi:hypothetical protein